MNIDANLLHLVNNIDRHVNQFPDNETGNMQLLTTVYDYMASFKQVMDGTTQVQMDYLAQNYEGFYRFSKLMEQIAQGISDGTLHVPKDH